MWPETHRDLTVSDLKKAAKYFFVLFFLILLLYFAMPEEWRWWLDNNLQENPGRIPLTPIR
jgi:hypothetical protein